MSEEIKVGEYIRTNKGTIGQIIEKRLGKFFKGKDEYIVKHSKKPIELVQIGDYVNGERVTNIMDNGVGTEMGRFIAKEHIDIILTHEMYEQNCYKVGED